MSLFFASSPSMSIFWRNQMLSGRQTKEPSDSYSLGLWYFKMLQSWTSVQCSMWRWNHLKDGPVLTVFVWDDSRPMCFLEFQYRNRFTFGMRSKLNQTKLCFTESSNWIKILAQHVTRLLKLIIIPKRKYFCSAYSPMTMSGGHRWKNVWTRPC